MSSSAMFKITQNTLHYFTLTEVLLMAAINQVEAKRVHLAGVCFVYNQAGKACTK